MSQRFVRIFIILFSVSICGSTDHQPTVTIKETKLLGSLHDNNEVEMFLGLPFAAPPVDDLRWEKPTAWIPDIKKEIIAIPRVSVPKPKQTLYRPELVKLFHGDKIFYRRLGIKGFK